MQMEYMKSDQSAINLSTLREILARSNNETGDKKSSSKGGKKDKSRV